MCPLIIFWLVGLSPQAVPGREAAVSCVLCLCSLLDFAQIAPSWRGVRSYNARLILTQDPMTPQFWHSHRYGILFHRALAVPMMSFYAADQRQGVGLLQLLPS